MGRAAARVDRGRNTLPTGGEVVMTEFPACQKCESGVLIPLSDYGRDGATIEYKAWVCTNPDCGFNLRIDNGEISIGRTVGQSLK